MRRKSTCSLLPPRDNPHHHKYISSSTRKESRQAPYRHCSFLSGPQAPRMRWSAKTPCSPEKEAGRLVHRRLVTVQKEPETAARTFSSHFPRHDQFTLFSSW